MTDRDGEPGATPTAPSAAASLLGWAFTLAATAFAVVIHHGVGPPPGGVAPHWTQPTAFLLRSDALAFAFESPDRALAFVGLPALALVMVIFVTGRSAVARAIGLASLFASLLFVFYGIAAPRPWELFGWRGSAALALTAGWVGIAASAPWLAVSWLRLGAAARTATYLPVAFAAVAFIRNATGTDPALRYSLSPWPAVPVFGIEVAGPFFAAAFLGVAVATRETGAGRARRGAAGVLGPTLAVAVIALAGALRLFPFTLGAPTLVVVASVCLIATVAVERVGIRGDGNAVARRSRALAIGAVLIAAPLVSGQILARSDYHATRDRRAQQLIEGLERYYERESLYPDALAELVAAGDLAAIPTPAIGFRFLGGADFHYQSFGTSYLFDFAAPRWVECAYSPPLTEEDEEDDEADEPLGGSWSCPAEPPELW